MKVTYPDMRRHTTDTNLLLHDRRLREDYLQMYVYIGEDSSASTSFEKDTTNPANHDISGAPEEVGGRGQRGAHHTTGSLVRLRDSVKENNIREVSGNSLGYNMQGRSSMTG